MRLMRLLALFALTACMPPTGADVSMNRPAAHSTSAAALPTMKSFGAPRVTGPGRSNTEIADNFLELEFRMESGRVLPVFTRFDGPITVRLTGAVPATAPQDLALVIRRFRTEAWLDVRPGNAAAAITVEFVPRATIRAAYANVACFVVPRVSSWAEYRAAKGTARLDWTTLTKRETVAIFVPSDSSPQEVRDCLHEELAQAMGPLNDLYQLPDSVFNDDNFHTVLTGFDILILRTHYAPELQSGMTRAEVASRLPGVLASLNPAGERPGVQPTKPTPRAWVDAIEAALGPRGAATARRAAAQKALTIAMAQGWTDSRLAFSYFAVGRLNLGHDATVAMSAFNTSAQIYRSLPGGQIHAAHVDMQLAALSLSNGDAKLAIALADRAIPVVHAGENAALLATLMLIKAEALAMQGHTDQARAVRLDSMGWARYGFGADSVVRSRLNDIAALVPAKLRG